MLRQTDSQHTHAYTNYSAHTTSNVKVLKKKKKKAYRDTSILVTDATSCRRHWAVPPSPVITKVFFIGSVQITIQNIKLFFQIDVYSLPDRQSASMCEQLAVVQDRPHRLSNGHRPTVEPDRRHSIINFIYQTDRQIDRQTDIIKNLRTINDFF